MGEGVRVVESLFSLLFLFGGEEGLGGRTLEKRLRVGWVM